MSQQTFLFKFFSGGGTKHGLRGIQCTMVYLSSKAFILSNHWAGFQQKWKFLTGVLNITPRHLYFNRQISNYRKKIQIKMKGW